MSRLRNVPGARERIETSRLCVCEPERLKGKWKTLFGNDHPIHIEIGMGKGRFLTRLAQINPGINYLGIELYSSVLIRAVEAAQGREEENFRFLRMDARELPAVFEAGEIERIYLNFSDPWPKDRHAKRRLTSPIFLDIYEQLLPEGALVEFKTDNTALFDYSLEQIEGTVWERAACTRDLYADPVLLQENVPTEYEEKFVRAGNRICKLILRKGRTGGYQHDQ